jgi:hypothetical protein
MRKDHLYAFYFMLSFYSAIFQKIHKCGASGQCAGGYRRCVLFHELPRDGARILQACLELSGSGKAFRLEQNLFAGHFLHEK